MLQIVILILFIFIVFLKKLDFNFDSENFQTKVSEVMSCVKMDWVAFGCTHTV